MPGTNFPSEKYLPPEAGNFLFDDVTNILTNADITFGNLEGCLLDEGKPSKKCKDSTKCYAFRIPTHFTRILKNAGFNLFNLANNHCLDFGLPGILSTYKQLDSVGIHYAGQKSSPYTIMNIGRNKIGFCGFSPFNGSVDMFDTDTVSEIIRFLDSLCNIVIVSIHAGAEGASHRNVTRQTEIFYDEDRGNIYDFSHFVIDCGADIVFGHGPHVTRAVELYKRRFIAYSLGNFCTYARFNLKDANGVAPIIKLFVKPDGEFLMAKVYSIIQVGEGIPVIDPERNALNFLIELSKSDFPENKLIFDNEGNVFPSNY